MRYILRSWLVLLLAGKVHAFEFPTNAVDWTNLLYSVNAVADLGGQFNWNTNEDVVSDFDKQVCNSLQMPSKPAMMVSYKEVSVVLHLSDRKQAIDSSQEMGGSLNLIYRDGKISRTNSEERVPANYIRLFDPHIKEPVAEVDLLLSVAPLEKPQDVKYVRRSFRFVRRDKWMPD